MALASMEAVLFSDAWSESSVSGTLASPFAAAFVAECGGECIGYLLSSMLAPEGELLRIGVHPAHRRRGVGRALMRRFLNEAAKRGCTEIFLEVRASNTGAQGLYLQYGFEQVGTRRGFYQHPREDAIVMRRILD